MLTKTQQFSKRLLDIVGAVSGLIALGWLIVPAILVARASTGKSGLFRQVRVGRRGREFMLLKIRTMRDVAGLDTTVTTEHDPRITRAGAFMRRFKIDELPQLINVLKGEMSLVGPRPDVPELMNQLSPQDAIILTIRPGITGPASLKYRDEETLLAGQADPEAFNRTVIFPDKNRINRQYVQEYSFAGDLVIIARTIVACLQRAEPSLNQTLEFEAVRNLESDQREQTQPTRKAA